MRQTLRDSTGDSHMDDKEKDVERGSDSLSRPQPGSTYSLHVKDSAEDAKQQWIDTSPESPRNWPRWQKWSIIIGLNFYTIIVWINLFGFLTDPVEDQFGVGTQVATLGISLFTVGVAIGPTILAPLSEIYGRQPIYIPSIFLFAILQIPSVLSPTYAGFAVTRFIVGCFAGLPLSNVGASANDLFNDEDLEWAVMSFSFSSQCVGPFIGPTIGGAIYVTTGTINWLYWAVLIFGMLGFVWSLTFGETLHDKVYEKATGIKPNRSARSYLASELFRAFRFLVTDPIVTASALTTTYLFGLIFIYFQGFPSVYEDEYNFNALQEGAMYLCAIGGGIVALVTHPLQAKMYKRSARFTRNGKPRPEARLYTGCFAVCILSISIFWFAFTSTHPSISYQIPMWSGFLFGYAEVAVYAGIWQYVTDAYGEYAGSALAACNLPANIISAALCHISIPEFENQGTKWALATLAFISLGFLVVPPLLIWQGPKLRKRSKYALGNSP